MERPSNVSGSQYAPQQFERSSETYAQCRTALPPIADLPANEVASHVLTSTPDLLASGDRVRLKVAGDEESLSRVYVLAANGTIALDGRLPVHIAGKSIVEAEKHISQKLLSEGLIRGLKNSVRLQLLELGGVSVAISGAVFQPGMIKVGQRNAETRGVNLNNSDSGDQNANRSLTTTLRAAGGVRPDADLSSVYVIRGDQWSRIDVSGAIYGNSIDDVPLTANDRIIVGSRECFQEALVKPSQITAPGIRVYMSNLSRPASNNASSAINRDATNLPYGTRLSQAMLAANCVGGSAMNAGRRVVLMSRNPINGKSVVIQRSVEKLVRNADRDNKDPYLMPGDGLTCYDSFAMNLRDVISLVGQTASPYVLLNSID
ncbi:polysaccharide biosynthesis/export family protein [Parasphingorhabdus sp.]|uniref:polysaccharide biosynthesis/export family protein n=1 Tax=Parasphingorhabdus sp. TaxID=2709688 RepID=UPI003267AC2C